MGKEQGKANTGQSSGGAASNIAKEELPQSNPNAETVLRTAKAQNDDAVKILDLLEKGNEEAIVLTGNPGTGKTWLAKEITKSAISTKGRFYMSLWISLKEKQEDYKSLHYSIARQLSIPTIGCVWEDADDIDDEKNEEFGEILEQLQPKVVEKLVDKMNEMEKSKKHDHETKHTFLLLVLDSEGGVKIADYDYIMKKLLPLEDLKKKFETKFSIKVLITSRNDEAFVSMESIRVVEIEPLSGDEAVAFLKKRVGNDVSEPPKFKTFCDKIQARNKVLPAQIIMLAEALNHIAKDGPEAQERAFDAALNILKHADKDDPIPLLHFIYEKLPGDCMIDCFWHSWNFLGKHGGVQYNELIAHWILEGHLDLAAGVKKAYEKGYHVMMELIDRGMLKMQEDNLIVLEGATLTLDDHSCRGLFETSNLGLAGMLEGDDSKVFERMAPVDGMMKTVSVDKTGKSVSSLLIDGSRPCREDPESFFQAKQNLKVLALFYPRLTSLPVSISKMVDLLVLVLRDCYLLNDIECIKDLKKLVVLEISGAPFLKKMTEELFENMSQLRSLNLSALGIKSLPSTVSSLTELRRLILRKCSFLEALPKLAKLKNLEVIDLSGCCSLIKIQEKSFQSFEKLRVIDFSRTKIEKLPIVQTLKNLTLLLVRGCDHLSGLRFMKHLPNFKVLDVSGAIRIKEIYYDCFEDTDNLRILDLSQTEIRFLPDSLGKHLCDLRLKGCSKLEKLPSTTSLTDLESLDLSNSSGLQKFPDGFFEPLTSLQSLNLSNTKVGSFPSLSKLHNLRHLLLKRCKFENLPGSKTFATFEGLINLVELDLSDCESLAEQLPSLKDLKYLEVINLSGYRALSEIDTSFEHMSWLQVLNLSETQISSLPRLCNPSKLRSLILNNCTKLQTSPDFEILTQLQQLDLRGTSSLKDINAESLSHLTGLQTLKLSKIALEGIQSSHLDNLKQLEVLDLSGEAVEFLPSLYCLSKLRQLLLRGCSSLTELPSLNSLSPLEVLDLSGTKVKNLGEKISALTNIKRLHLPEEVIEEFKEAENVRFLPLEIKLDCCCISKPSEIPEGDKKPRIVVHGTGLLKSLKEIRAQSKDEDNYGDSRKHIFSDIYAKIRKLPFEAKDGQSLEIHGFDDFPTDIEVLLEHAKYVLLVENSFFKNLSDLKPDGLKNIKGCWLERCNKMESIFMEADLGKWGTLEILWISNLPKLKSMYDEKVQSLSFGNLKHLYIDCCPTLETVFTSRQIPETLETLQITFCDKLKTLVGDKGSANKEVQTTGSTNKEVQTTRSADKEVQTTGSADKEVRARTMSSAKKEVQNASSIGKEMEAQTKSSADKEVHAQTMSLADKEVRATSSADEEVEAQTPSSADKEVQTQTMSLADKEVQATSSEDKEVKAQTKSSADKEVQTTISGDKEVEAQTTSSADKGVQAQTISLADKGVQAKSSADKEVQAQTASSANKEVQAQTMSSADKEVRTTSRSSLDKEVQAQTASSANKEVQAQTMSSADKEVQTTSRTNLKHLHISYCPMLETVFSSAQLPKNLEILQIKYCDQLKSVFGPELNKPELPNLHKLQLLELPAWTRFGIGFKLNESVKKDVSPNIEKSLMSDYASKETTRADGN